MSDRIDALVDALTVEHGCVAIPSDRDGDRRARIAVSEADGREVSLATISRVRQTCVERGYHPEVRQSNDGRTLLLDCRAGKVIRRTVERVALDEDGLLVKLAGEPIHCVPLPATGTIERRTLLMMRAGDDVTIGLFEDRSGTLVVDGVSNGSMSDG